MSLKSIDTAVTPILAELQTKQAAAFLKNGKYAQLFASHAVTPSGIPLPPQTKVDVLRDEDIFPKLPETMDYAFRVDETIHPSNKHGWVLWVWTKDSSQLYVKAWTTGPDADAYPSDWIPTENEPND